MPDIIPPTVVPVQPPAPSAAPAAAKPEVIQEPSDAIVGSKMIDTFKKLMEPEALKPKEEPPVKPADKPAEPVDPMENPAGLSPKASEQFKHIKGSRDEWRTKAKTFEDERTKLLADLEAAKKAATTQPTVDPAEIESLKKQLSEYDQQLRIASIERHPKFKAHFDTAMTSAVSLAEESVGKDHAAKLKAILKMPDGETRDEQLEALSTNLTPLQQGKLAAALIDVQKVERERSSELAKAAADYDKVTAHEKAQTEKQTSDQRAKSESRLKESFNLAANVPAFKADEADATSADRVKEYENVVRAYHAGKLPDSMVSAMPVMAMQALHQKQVIIPALQAELKKRDDIIASFTKASPSAAGGSAKPVDAGGDLPEGDKFYTVFSRNNPTAKR